MSEDSTTRQTRRSMLKAVGATGLALGAAGTAAANTDDVQSDGATTEGTWESRCLSYLGCTSGSSCQRQRRYCSGGECSGWENDGCCATQYC